MLRKHYSPKARLVMMSWASEQELEAGCAAYGVSREKVQVIAHSRVPGCGRWGRVSVIAHDAQGFARSIYAELHRCDEAGAELIIVEALPEGEEWRGLADRLKRAAA